MKVGRYHKKTNKKHLAEYQARVQAINMAHVLYRSALEALVGWGAFQNIDAAAMRNRISLHESAKQWVEGFWNE